MLIYSSKFKVKAACPYIEDSPQETGVTFLEWSFYSYETPKAIEAKE